jgi:hypothetical protein
MAHIESTPALSSEAPEAPARARVARKPFGNQQLKLARPDRPGFKRRFFNDVPGRIVRAKEAGWEIVMKANGEPDTEVVGVAETGGALLAYLMETPEEFYNEDYKDQQAQIDDMERSFKRGADNHGQVGQDGRYIPSRGITIKTV